MKQIQYVHCQSTLKIISWILISCLICFSVYCSKSNPIIQAQNIGSQQQIDSIIEIKQFDTLILSFAANLQSNISRNTVVFPTYTLGGRAFVVCDFDTNFVYISSKIIVKNISNNIIFIDTLNYTFQNIRNYFDIRVDLTPTTTLSEIESLFTLSYSTSVYPDTLRPIYPNSIMFDKDYIFKICGPNSQEKLCVPSWICIVKGTFLLEHIISINDSTIKNPMYQKLYKIIIE